MARHPMIRSQFAHLGILHIAKAGLRDWTARMEMASGRGGDETRRFTRKTLAHRQAIRRVRVRNGAHEGFRVGVQGLPQDAADGTLFHQSPGVHDANAV